LSGKNIVAVNYELTVGAQAAVAALMGSYAALADAALTGAPTLNGVPVATTDDAFINALILGG
jgi:hypothetical protein